MTKLRLPKRDVIATPIDELLEEDLNVARALMRHQRLKGVAPCHLRDGPGLLERRQRRSLVGVRSSASRSTMDF